MSTVLDDFVANLGRVRGSWWRRTWRCVVCGKRNWTRWGNARHNRGRRHRKGLEAFQRRIDRMRAVYQRLIMEPEHPSGCQDQDPETREQAPRTAPGYEGAPDGTVVPQFGGALRQRSEGAGL